MDNASLKEFLQCHFHRKILRDSARHSTRRMGIRAANQIGKTTIAEIILKFRMKHDPGDMMVWDMSEEKSNDHMKNRFGPILQADPVLGPMFSEIKDTPETRWNVTTQDIKLPGMVFRARPLNEGWTQSIFLRYGAIHDAALVDPKQVRRSELRFTQHEMDYLWIVESQGDAVDGKIGGGFTEFMGKTNEMKLHVRCPVCGTRQRFLFHTLRTEETKIVAPLFVGSLEREAWVSEHRKMLLSEERKHAGFRVEGELKLDDGGINEQSIMANTVYECPHCGGIWRDDNVYHSGGKVSYGVTRSYLDREAGLDENWIPTRTTAMPGYLGYSLPRWINPKPSWGGIMLTFKQAMAAKKMGSLMQLQEFRTKWAGEDWDEHSESRRETKISVGTYETDPDKLTFAAGTMRLLSADVGKSPLVEENVISASRLFFEIRDWNNNKDGELSLTRGASIQITRGMVEDCFMDTPDGPRKVTAWELFSAQQFYWKITNRHVLIDMAYAQSQVIEAAAKYHEIVDSAFRPVSRADYGKQTDFPLCWRMCSGSQYQRIGPKKRPYHQDFIKEPARFHDKSGRKRIAYLDNIVWSNYWFEDQFERIVREKSTSISWKNLAQDKLVIVGLDLKPNAELMQKYVEFEQDKPESGQFRSWDSGLGSRTFDPVKHKYVDNDKAAYAKKQWTEPRDCGLMQLVGAAAEGMLGHVATEE